LAAAGFVAAVACASLGAVSLAATAWSPFPSLPAGAGFVVVVRSLAAREARPGRVILGLRIRGMSGLPSGMGES
jgi:hypothetical protein